jgi:DUF1680 family protein
LGGVLGAALAANHAGRLSHFITDPTSPAIALFSPEHVRQNEEGDWYGEHAGKWLYAAAKAAHRTGDVALSANVRRVADYLANVQGADGYLGTYAPSRRFMHRQPPAAPTWDGAPAQRTWDIWTHAYLVLGLLEVHKYFPALRYLNAARKIGDLCARTLDDGIDITTLGNHYGLSATVLLDPAVELYFATHDRKYLDLAQRILKQANDRTGILNGADASEIATGKAYQLCWNFVGIAKLYKATHEPRLLEAVRKFWTNVRDHHLTLGGGPWGGVAHRSREVFNHHTVFSPYGYVETCATLAWIQLNRELLALTGDAIYAEEIERSAFNDLLGAQAPNGEDWCYYSFPNGKRVYTTYWRCCKSSGAMALEELPGLAYSVTAESDIAVNLYGPSKCALPTPRAGVVSMEQTTRYPFDGAISLRIELEQSAAFAVRLRIPSWARGAAVCVNGERTSESVEPGTYAVLERNWQGGDRITLDLPMRPVLHERTSRSVQESRAPNGAPIAQEVMRYDYVAITRGPLVYATGLIDGFKTEESIRLENGTPEEIDGPAIRLNVRGRPPLVFYPYYEAGGRKDGAWRLTWMQLAPATENTP